METTLCLREISKSSSYAEYGVGESTIWVSSSTMLPVRAVDTSQTWAEAVAESCSNNPLASIEWIDVGDVGNWGRPKSYDQFHKYKSYFESPWKSEFSPDLVLVDGRFRVACFLTSLLKAKPGTVILFDDYIGRRHYHVVERFLVPSERSNRQALFRVPDVVDYSEVTRMRDKFEFVFD